MSSGTFDATRWWTCAAYVFDDPVIGSRNPDVRAIAQEALGRADEQGRFVATRADLLRSALPGRSDYRREQAEYAALRALGNAKMLAKIGQRGAHGIEYQLYMPTDGQRALLHCAYCGRTKTRDEFDIDPLRIAYLDSYGDGIRCASCDREEPPAGRHCSACLKAYDGRGATISGRPVCCLCFLRIAPDDTVEQIIAGASVALDFTDLLMRHGVLLETRDGD